MPDEKPQFQASNMKNALSLALTTVTHMKNEQIDLSKNSLVVVTAAGTIYGTAITNFSDDSIEDKIFSVPYDQALELIKPDVPNYCLILKDATLVSGQGFKQSFKTLFVFPEDIIAITIADASDI